MSHGNAGNKEAFWDCLNARRVLGRKYADADGEYIVPSRVFHGWLSRLCQTGDASKIAKMVQLLQRVGRKGISKETWMKSIERLDWSRAAISNDEEKKKVWRGHTADLLRAFEESGTELDRVWLTMLAGERRIRGRARSSDLLQRWANLALHSLNSHQRERQPSDAKSTLSGVPKPSSLQIFGCSGALQQAWT